MKKIFIAILVLTVIGAVITIGSINYIVKAGIEKFGPKITRTTVTVGSVNLSPLSGSGSISDLVVGNPEGFKAEHIFKLSKISFKLDTSSLMAKNIIINDISIESPDIVYELNQGGTNLDELLRAVRSSSYQNSTEVSSGEKSGEYPEKKVVIENLKIMSGNITLAASLLNSESAGASTILPDIHLKDIGKTSGGATFPEAITKVITAVSKKVATVSLDPNNLKGAADGLKGTLDGAADKLKGLFD